MKNRLVLSESEELEIKSLNKDIANGGLSTEEMIARLNAVPFEEFQKGLKEKIRKYKLHRPT